MESISAASVRIPPIQRDRVLPGYAGAAGVLSRSAAPHEADQHTQHRLASRRQRGERDSSEHHLGDGNAVSLEREPREPKGQSLVGPGSEVV